MASTTAATEPPSLIESFHNALLKVYENPCPQVPNPPNCKKRASVAVILRVRAQYNHLPKSPVTVADKGASTSQQLSDFFAQDWVQHGDPELLFIKRASRVGDRWTGHVALPGGKRDPEDEDDKAAAVREAQEEVGLDLTTEDLIYIGNLPERVVTTSFGSVPLMVLCPFIFLLTSNNGPALTLQPTEVASTHWVSLRALLSPSLRSVEYVNVSARYAKQHGLIRWGSSRWMTGMMEFSALRLLPTESLYSSTTPGFLPDETHQEKPSMLQRFNPWAVRQATYGEKNRELLLWGLTLGIMADFLDLLPPHNAVDLWKHPTFTAPDLRLIVSLLTYSIRKRNATKVKEARRPSQTAADDSTMALSVEDKDDQSNDGMTVSGHEHATAILLQGYYDRLRLSLGVFAIALLTTSCAASPKESIILNLNRPKLSTSLDSPATDMVATQKLYPRGTVKRIVKAHAGRSISKNADVLIFLDYMLFMQELMREASIRSRRAGEKGISARNIRRVTEATLRKMKG